MRLPRKPVVTKIPVVKKKVLPRSKVKFTPAKPYKNDPTVAIANKLGVEYSP